MSVYDAVKVVNMNQLRFNDNTMKISLETSSDSESNTLLKDLDLSFYFSMLDQDSVQLLTIRPAQAVKNSFLCKLSKESISLTLVNSIRKIVYVFDMKQRVFTMNGRVANVDMMSSFLDKLEHIMHLLDENKAVAEVG